MNEDVGRVTAVEVAVAATCIATKGRRVCEDGGGLGHELTAAVKSVAAETDRLVFKALVVQETHIPLVFVVGDENVCTQFFKL